MRTLWRVLPSALLCTLLLVMSSPAHAGGWHDYILDIGDGFLIHKTEATGTCLATCGGRVIVSPGELGTGPLTGYSISDNFILIRHEALQSEKELFFIYDKEPGRLHGPFDREAFALALTSAGISMPEWIRPRNPDPLAPLVATVMFILISTPFLYYNFIYITLPLTALIVYIGYRALKRRRRRKEA